MGILESRRDYYSITRGRTPGLPTNPSEHVVERFEFMRNGLELPPRRTKCASSAVKLRQFGGETAPVRR
jgi:hypothetical protein